jgi:hypothetical protein
MTQAGEDKFLGKDDSKSYGKKKELVAELIKK